MRPHSTRPHGNGPRVIRPAAGRDADAPAAEDPHARALAPAAIRAGRDAGAAPAPPGREPTAEEVDAIARAVFASPLVAAVPHGRLQVDSIRISTGSPDWAFVALRPHEYDLDPAVAVLRWNVSGGWVLDQVGTAQVGVGRVPVSVSDEFDLDDGR
ncbi:MULTISPECIES: hypothetical protein [Protofrankia]|uniref:Uncharacterized protein n=1 Tax=Candidatus Protofrankia datiscae TaxID=2716812 RepID=F8B001_9ACTN|nr:MULTISPECIES: hypothetical protein [Protofrankia]AEH11698.1 hypothetical protein FsymDg_4449 [Candidatus Protofrankia datiscae]